MKKYKFSSIPLLFNSIIITLLLTLILLIWAQEIYELFFENIIFIFLSLLATVTFVFLILRLLTINYSYLIYEDKIEINNVLFNLNKVKYFNKNEVIISMKRNFIYRIFNRVRFEIITKSRKKVLSLIIPYGEELFILKDILNIISDKKTHYTIDKDYLSNKANIVPQIIQSFIFSLLFYLFSLSIISIVKTYFSNNDFIYNHLEIIFLLLSLAILIIRFLYFNILFKFTNVKYESNLIKSKSTFLSIKEFLIPVEVISSFNIYSLILSNRCNSFKIEYIFNRFFKILLPITLENVKSRYDIDLKAKDKLNYKSKYFIVPLILITIILIPFILISVYTFLLFLSFSILSFIIYYKENDIKIDDRGILIISKSLFQKYHMIDINAVRNITYKRAIFNKYLLIFKLDNQKIRCMVDKTLLEKIGINKGNA